jgi:hypothetical protein
MYGRTIIIVTKKDEIRKNLNFVNFVINRLIINPKYKKNIIPNAKKLYLKDNFRLIHVNKMNNLAV